MIYQEATNRVEHPSLMADSASLIEALMEIRQRLSKMADSLHGPIPQEVAGVGKQEPPVPNTVRRNIDTAMRLASSLSDEISRIERGI